ncbi:hypothetical protein H4R20_003585 [Coemansia guatemalensis]|uniref:Protein kinase domain-containing protein n=1 Tax=Coemansia guatemalensis TaxID=2761395 RepID=A0A9W8I1I9_9FUNG|nr:hypothetical protein H4R20_003585 [Coemansia guatemalensis]
MEKTREAIEADIQRRVTTHFGQGFALLEKLDETENIKFGHISRVVHKARDGDGKIVAIIIVDSKRGRKQRQLESLNIAVNELHALDFVRENTTIPVSKVHKMVVDDQYIFQVMDFIEGTILSSVYDTLDKSTFSAIEKQLREYISQLRKFGGDGKALIHGCLGTYSILVNGDKVTALTNWGRSKEDDESEELRITSAKAWDDQKEFIANLLR